MATASVPSLKFADYEEEDGWMDGRKTEVLMAVILYMHIGR